MVSPNDDNNKTPSIAQRFCNFFSNIPRSLKQKSLPLKDFVWRIPNITRLCTTAVFKFKYVPKISIENQLKRLSKKKPSGVDNIPARLLRDSATAISQPITYLINLSLQTGNIPEEWKTARITPIHKSGSITSTDNYRPISVLPILSKILESNVHTQLMEYVERHGLLSKNQFGYRTKRSTELATTLFLDNIRRSIDNGNIVGALFVDLSKAFDTLGHSVLLNKLSAYGVKGQELIWFKQYLFNRKQTVQYGIETSQSMHFNDIEDSILQYSLMMFADDTV